MTPQKFENVDITSGLQRIMDQNTAFYQSDFRFDEDLIWSGALSQSEKDRNLIWFSHPSGTYSFREWDTFLLDTWPNQTLRYFAKQESVGVLAYAVEITGAEGDSVFGNLYPLDFLEYWKEVQQNAVRPDFVEAAFPGGRVRSFPFEEYLRHFSQIAVQYGNVEKQNYILKKPEPLERLLAERWAARSAAPVRNFPAHIRGLREQKVLREAERLLVGLEGPPAPNSPDKTCYIAEVSPYFLRIADEKDKEKLSRLLPFQSLELTALAGKDGLYATISQSENRSHPIDSLKTSVLKKLRQPSAQKPPVSGRPRKPKSKETEL